MTDLYPLLNGRRGTQAKTQEVSPQVPVQNPWSWPVIWAGMSDIQTILIRAARSLRLDRSLFLEVAVDPYATGQALLIALLLGLGTLVIPLLSIVWPALRSQMLISGTIVLMLGMAICLVLATIAGKYRQQDHSFTRSFNAIAYAGVGGFVAWFAPLNFIGPLLLITGILIVLVACWLAIQEAMGLSRWPAVAIPLLSFLLASLVLLALSSLVGGEPISISLIFP
jgi:hypothetical protein